MSIRKQLMHAANPLNISRLLGHLRPPPGGNNVESRQAEEIMTKLVKCLEYIIQTFDCRNSPTYFPVVAALLESLPLTTAEYELARLRLDNVQRYADSYEAGAAVYELRILLSKFRNNQ